MARSSGWAGSPSRPSIHPAMPSTTSPSGWRMAFAAFPAAMPEFKNEKQLATWRAEQASKADTRTAEETHAFYTGKPYVDSSGGYAFLYRSYNPELARWTSQDPSGFPDGANGNIYAPVPTIGLDALGLFYSGSYYDSSCYGDGSMIFDPAAWTAGRMLSGPLTNDSMNHADGTTPGDWTLTTDENAAAKAASAGAVMKDDHSILWTVQVSNDLKAAFGNSAAGTYTWAGVAEHALFPTGDLHSAVGGCYLIASGSVVITN